MRKILVMFFSVLLVAFLSTSFAHIEKSVDNDVGYSLTLDQEVTVISTISVPVLSGEMNYLLARGVSVPYRGLINQETILNIKFNQYQEESLIDYDLNQSGENPTLRENTNQLRGRYRLDIGETTSVTNIV